MGKHRGRIGPAAKAAVPDLIGTLKQKEPLNPARLRAAIALGGIGAEAKDAVPALIETLREKEKGGLIGYHAAEALGKIGPAA